MSCAGGRANAPSTTRRDELAAKFGTGAQTVKNFEFRGSDPKLGTVQKWQRALDSAGERVMDADDRDGPCVRLNPRRSGEIWHGKHLRKLQARTGTGRHPRAAREDGSTWVHSGGSREGGRQGGRANAGP